MKQSQVEEIIAVLWFILAVTLYNKAALWLVYVASISGMVSLIASLLSAIIERMERKQAKQWK